MEWLTIIYLIYAFIGLYFLIFFLLIYFRNRKSLFNYPKITEKYEVSFVIPVYNEEKSIKDSLNSLLNLDYPIKKIVVVNDASTDNTEKIIKEMVKKHKEIKLVSNSKNLGKSGSLNKGLEYVKTELVAIVDADSYPEKDSLKKLIGYFNDEKVGVATPAIFVKNSNKFIEYLQAVEYVVIAWTRKLLGYVDAIYVTPGPLAVYRKKVLDEVGGFDINNITEDIEMTWRLTKYKYKREMNLSSKVYTTVPNKFKHWLKQRIRWNLGGLQTIIKYKSETFSRNMISYFILPFFTLSLLMGVVGLLVFFYMLIRNIILHYLSTSYSVAIQSALIASQGINMNASVLNFLGFSMLILGAFFTFLALTVMKQKKLRNRNVFNLGFYLIVYLSVYPFIMLISIYKFIKKDIKW